MKYPDEILERIADLLKVLSEPMRLKILQTLRDGEMAVQELHEALGGSQANISKHLGVLKRAGLVKMRKSGLKSYYRLGEWGVFEICDSICDTLKRKLQQDKEMWELLP